MSRRSEQLKTVCGELNRVHDEWVESGDARPSPDESYWDAVEDVEQAFREGEIPADCRELKEAVDKFLDEVSIFDNRADVADTYPRESFWQARDGIEKSLSGLVDVPALKPLESMQSLRDLKPTKVEDMQIALMYGLRDRRGNLMPQLVQKEIDSPGSVLKTKGAVDGRDWVDPRLPAYAHVAAQEASERDGGEDESGNRSASGRKRNPTLADKTAAATEHKPCPESPADLFLQGLTASQASVTLHMPLEDVAKLWNGFEEKAAARVAANVPATPAVVTATTPAPSPPQPTPPTPHAKQTPPPGGLLSGGAGAKQQAAAAGKV